MIPATQSMCADAPIFSISAYKNYKPPTGNYSGQGQRYYTPVFGRTIIQCLGVVDIPSPESRGNVSYKHNFQKKSTLARLIMSEVIDTEH